MTSRATQACTATRMELLTAPRGRAAAASRSRTIRPCSTRLQQRLVSLGVDRHAFVVGIGGGALLDPVGYAAASTHRGVRLVRVPTTVLAQNDSGVGVKNGVNAFGVKNFLGTFAPPFAVLNDSRFLRTLPPRDTIAGMAEAVKVALIRDAAFFALARGATPRAGAVRARRPWRTMIRRCAELHMRHIAQGGDPFETGSARPLDFGHWAAHKLESADRHELRHGEAVAIGLALDTRYSALAGMLSAAAKSASARCSSASASALARGAGPRDADGHWLLRAACRSSASTSAASSPSRCCATSAVGERGARRWTRTRSCARLVRGCAGGAAAP